MDYRYDPPKKLTTRRERLAVTQPAPATPVAANATVPGVAQTQQPIAITVQLPPPADPHWTAYWTALGTPIFSFIAAAAAIWIAHRNWRTAQNKLKLDLFDRRVKVYAVIREAMNKLATDRILEAQELVDCYDAMFDSEWLFSKNVYSYLANNTVSKISECRAMAKRVHELKVELLDPSGDAYTKEREHEEAERKLKEMVDGISRARAEVRARLAPFLTLKH